MQFLKNMTLNLTQLRLVLKTGFLCALFIGFTPKTYAQTASCGSPGILAQWNFDSNAVECNGAVPFTKGYELTPSLKRGLTYCPNENAGCGKGLLGSGGHANTDRFSNGVCLLGFYDNTDSVGRGGCSFDATSSVWNPEECANLKVNYEIPSGKEACLTAFGLKVLQKQFSGTIGFEKQGVAVKRNGVLIYSQTQNLAVGNINATPLNFPFTGDAFCTDGSANVNYEIIFGLVKQLLPNSMGYDDITIYGTCGGPALNAEATPATCGIAGPLTNGKITLTGYQATDHADFNMGLTYTNGATYPTAPTIPGGGILTSTLPNPSTPQPYTIRVFDQAGCTTDKTVTLNPIVCPPPVCIKPTGTVVAPSDATCSGSTANNNAQIAITGVTNGNRVGISPGTSYTGPAYSSAQNLTAGARTYSNLPNPVGSQVYTIRVFNGGDTCYEDYTTTINETLCGPCRKATAEVYSSDASDPDSTPNNNTSSEDDLAVYELCKDTGTIDLNLSKSVTPNTGGMCPSPTDFTWTVTLQNQGSIPATSIKIVDDLPEGLVIKTATPSVGTFSLFGGWEIPTLAAGASATLTLVTNALQAGSFQNCVSVSAATPANDSDASDNQACNTITVTGSQPPSLEKMFSPMLTKPNTATRMIISIVNNESTPITLTAPLVDNLPSSPAQMRIAATPNLVSSISGVVATANDTKVTIPSGVTLLPGLNELKVDVTVPSAGQYCNTIAVGDLQTSTCGNPLQARACIMADNTFVLAPIISKSFNPPTLQTGQTGALILSVENRNASSMTLEQNLVDYMPTNLVVAPGTVNSTCGTVSAPVGGSTVTLNAGSVIPAGTCTISVPVRSSIAGIYCNVIPMNALITTVGGVTNVGNEDVATACQTVTPTPCTTATVTSISVSPSGPISPGDTVTLTANVAGGSASTIYNWTATGGTFSNTGTRITTWTAPATGSSFSVNVNVNNNATGHGSCVDDESASLGVGCTPPAPFTLSAVQPTCATPTGSISFNTFPAAGTYVYNYDDVTPYVTGILGSNAPATSTTSILSLSANNYTVRLFDATDTACFTDANIALNPPTGCGPTPQPDLRLLKTASAASVVSGQTLTYTLTLINEGTAPATGVQVRDVLPSSLSFVSATPSQGTYTVGTGIWDVGTVAAGETKTLTITVTVN